MFTKYFSFVVIFEKILDFFFRIFKSQWGHQFEYLENYDFKLLWRKRKNKIIFQIFPVLVYEIFTLFSSDLLFENDENYKEILRVVLYLLIVFEISILNYHSLDQIFQCANYINKGSYHFLYVYYIVEACVIIFISLLFTNSFFLIGISYSKNPNHKIN